jgi:hypothetical protein
MSSEEIDGSTETRGRFPCDDCGKSFTRNASRKRHEKSHLDQRDFMCTYPGCFKSFVQPGDRDRHVQTHEKAEASYSHVCTDCGRRFQRKYDLVRHCAAKSTRRSLNGSSQACVRATRGLEPSTTVARDPSRGRPTDGVRPSVSSRPPVASPTAARSARPASIAGPSPFIDPVRNQATYAVYGAPRYSQNYLYSPQNQRSNCRSPRGSEVASVQPFRGGRPAQQHVRRLTLTRSPERSPVTARAADSPRPKMVRLCDLEHDNTRAIRRRLGPEISLTQPAENQDVWSSRDRHNRTQDQDLVRSSGATRAFGVKRGSEPTAFMGRHDLRPSPDPFMGYRPQCRKAPRARRVTCDSDSDDEAAYLALPGNAYPLNGQVYNYTAFDQSSTRLQDHTGGRDARRDGELCGTTNIERTSGRETSPCDHYEDDLDFITGTFGAKTSLTPLRKPRRDISDSE